MTVSLPEELEHQVETEIALGDFGTSDQLVVEAVRKYLNWRRVHRRRDALNRIARAVDEAGLYDQAGIPTQDE